MLNIIATLSLENMIGRVKISLNHFKIAVLHFE